MGRPWVWLRPAHARGHRIAGSRSAGISSSSGPRARISDSRRLCRFPHDVADLAGERGRTPRPGMRRGLDEDDLASDRRIGQAGRDTRNASCCAVSAISEEYGRRRDTRRRSFRRPTVWSDLRLLRERLSPPGRGTPCPMLPFQVRARRPHACIRSMTARRAASSNDHPVRPEQSVLLELSPTPGTAWRSPSSRGACSPTVRDHSMRSRSAGGDRVHVVGRTDEEDLREIEGHAEIVIGEGVVLLRVEHFEQRRGRIAAKIGADLVEFIKHDQRVVRVPHLRISWIMPAREWRRCTSAGDRGCPPRPARRRARCE